MYHGRPFYMLSMPEKCWKISKEQKTKARLDIVRPYMETYTFALPPELLPPVFDPAPIEEKGDNAHYSEYTLHTDVLWVIYQSNSGWPTRNSFYKRSYK